MYGPSVTFNQFIKIFVAGYYSLISFLFFIYIFIDERIINWNISLQIALYGFLGLVVGLIIESSDPLLYFKKRIENKFFLDNMPSKYLLERCKQCSKFNECENVLTEKTYISAWFYIFDNLFPEYLRNYSFMTTAMCRVIYYLKYISLIFFIFATIYFLILSINYFVFFFYGVSLIQNPLIYIKGLLYKLIFIIFFVTVYIIIKKTNRPDENPTGIWKRWRGLRNDLEFWLEINKETLTKVICERGVPYG
ncbi:MAG: hypothetical protein ACTSPQ_19755 [Candidatus Helarchaeota archaeon]